MNFENTRRAFLKTAAKFTALATAGSIIGITTTTTAFGHEENRSATRRETTTDEGIYLVSMRANLFDKPRQLELRPDQYSEIVDFGASGSYRIKITPVKKMTQLGKGYVLMLTDVNGKQLDSMNIVDSTTATFSRYGVQIHMISFQAAQSATGS